MIELDLALNKTFKNLEERLTPKLIVRNEKDVWQIEMFHVINVGKINPEADFASYLHALMREFRHEMSRTTVAGASLPPTSSHHVMLDEQDALINKINNP